jgi:histidine triad (HIT) family protein
MPNDDCIFCNILSKQKPGQLEYEDEDIVVLWDINPQAPVHLLVIPRKHLACLSDFTGNDTYLLTKMMTVAQKVSKRLRLNEKGFRLVINDGRDAGQSIFHLHMHLLSGRRMVWPPG